MIAYSSQTRDRSVGAVVSMGSHEFRHAGDESTTDLEDLIKKLQRERSALDEVLVSLTAMRSSLMEARAAAKRRGRKSMGTEERLVVAERMKKYWAMRRQSNLST
jgi:hypothetical protein